MEKINIFNYEIFYLDFLEGNLNEENTSLLLAFLEEHPELKMEDDFLPTLEKESFTISFNKKEELKQVFYSDEINESNIEDFLIAKAENLLTEKESVRVEKYLSINPIYKNTERLFKAVYLQADKTQVFAKKESLKKKKVLVLWPYISIAASLLIAFLIWNFGQDTNLEDGKIKFSKKEVFQEKRIKNTEIKFEKKRKEKQQEPKIIYESVPAVTSSKAIQYGLNKSEQSFFENNTIDTLSIRKQPTIQFENNQPVLFAYKNKELKPVHKKEQDLNDSPIASTMGKDNMINPIEPITAFLEEKTNTIIEYKKQQKTKNQPKKLFIKVGKFEFYRKKH